MNRKHSPDKRTPGPVHNYSTKRIIRLSPPQTSFVFTSSTYNMDGSIARPPGSRPTLSQSHLTLHAKDAINSSLLDYRLLDFIHASSSPRSATPTDRQGGTDPIDYEVPLEKPFPWRALFGSEMPTTQKTSRPPDHQEADAGSDIDANKDPDTSSSSTPHSSAPLDSLSTSTEHEEMDTLFSRLCFNSSPSSPATPPALWGPGSSSPAFFDFTTTLAHEVSEGRAPEHVGSDRKSRSFAYPMNAPVVVEGNVDLFA